MTLNLFDHDPLNEDKSLSEYEVLGLAALDGIDDEDESDSAASAGASERYQYIDSTLLLTPDAISNGKKLYAALDYKTYEAFALYNARHATRYLESRTLSYDIETNAEDPISAKAKIIGFSNAFEPNSGIYVVREALDYSMPDDDWNRIVDLFKQLMDFSLHVVVHNRKYENPYTINCMNYEITNDKIEDTMIKCRIIYPGEQAGLKPAAARLLGYSDWDAMLSMYTKAVKGIIGMSVEMNRLKKITEKRKSDYAIYEDILTFKSIIDPAVFMTKLSNQEYALTEYATHWMSVLQVFSISGILTTHMLDLLVQKINEVVAAGGLTTDVIPYSMIPVGVLAKYGALDAIATYELNDHCDAQFNVKSNEIKSILHSITHDDTYDKFDLHAGYEIVKAQFDAGINLEMAGAKWNDDVANFEHQWHNNKAIEAWYALFDNEAFAYEIKEKARPALMKSIIVKNLLLEQVEEHLFDSEADVDLDAEVDLVTDEDTIPVSQAIKAKIIAYLESKGRIKLQKSQVKFLDIIVDNGLVGKPLCVKFTALYKGYSADLDQLLRAEYDYAFAKLIDRSKITDYTQLKAYYNPAKSDDGHYAMVHKLLVGPSIRYAVIYAGCIRQIALNRYWETADPEIMGPSIDLYTYLAEIKQRNDALKLAGLPVEDQADIFAKFSYLIEQVDLETDDILSDIMKIACEYTLTSLKEPVLLDLYSKMLHTGVNPEDESTWTPEFRWLYNFRTYKKCVKIITSYIHGSVGRKSVTVVDRSSLNDLLPIRKRMYNDTQGQYDPETEELLMSIEFGICTAETGRWRSGFHTVPAGSTIKNTYTSRFKGGVICSPDYSQMEVRAIAAAAKETAMLDAFNAGEDIHQRTAASVYQKTKEAVTDTERKFSKAVTFAVIYGAAEQNIADNFMNGDYSKAKAVMDSFFVTYPKLKSWIDTMHALWRKTGYVVLASNRLIKIEIPERSDPKYNMKMSKGPRCAQNYPIQGLSTDVAGYVLHKLIGYIKRGHSLSRAFSFVHDALYFDLHPMELFTMLKTISYEMNTYPMDTYGLPAAADMVVGVSMGQELKMKDLERVSMTEGYLSLSGYEDDFDLLIENWKSVYTSVSYEDIDAPHSVYVPRADLFAPKKTISRYFGLNRTVVKRRVHIVM